MKTLLYLIITFAIFFNFEVLSQCSADIDIPSAAITNCGSTQVNSTATGPGPYQYSWSSPTISFSSTTIANPTISSTTFGWQTFTLLVVDNNNCTSVVTDSIQFFDHADTIYQTYCSLPDSVCTVLPVQVNLGWTYTDSSGVAITLPTTDCVAIVGPGSYEFTGVLDNFCTVSHTFIVTEDCGTGTGCSATINAPDIATSNCAGPQISATAIGSGPYQYLWSSSNGLTFSSTTDANPYISSTVPGWYYYSVLIVDANNCTSLVEDSVEFFDPGASFDVTYCSLPDTICAIGSPVSLLGWDYTDTNGVTTALGATSCVSIVGPGTYEFFGIYESNCTVIHTYYVTQDCGTGTGCSATINAPDIAISNCVGPQISATSTGSGPYQYLWSSSNGLTFSSTTVANPYISSTVPGWYYYSVLIVDANNCTSLVEDSVEFFDPGASFDVTYCSLPDTICAIGSPVSLLGWDYTDTNGVISALGATSCVSIVGPGTYEFFGIYESNCTVIHTYYVTQDCGTGTGCSATINAPDIAISNCAGPQISATATGPGPYQYTWSSPSLTFSSTTDANPYISSTVPGWYYYSVLIVDANNCTSLVEDSVEFFDPGASFDVTYCSLPDTICAIGSPVSLLGWDYTDTNGVISALGATSCVSIVGPGTYEFFGIYESNCTVIHTYYVTQDCGTGTGCSATINAPDIAISNCVGPQISATATGPGPYQYTWSSPSLTFSSTTVANPYISSTVPGWYYYSVLIVDANNCTSLVEDSVEFFDPGASFDVTYCSLPDTICAIGSPVSLLGWDYTDTNGVTTALGTTSCVSIVGPGTYEFFGIYESNCTVIHTYYVTQDCGTGTGCSATINAPSKAISNCVGPQISATATGPGPYQYTWSSPSLTFSSTTVVDPYISATVPGWYYYSVLIVDANNCTSLVTDSVEFFEPVDTIYQTYCALPDSVCVLDIPIMSFLGWTYTHPSGTTTNLPSTDCVEIVGPGIYEFTGVYESNCTVIHTYVVSEDCGNVGVDEVLNEYEPYIYPNPATFEINVRLPSSKCDRWEIVDLFGKTCLSGSSDEGEFKIKLQDIADGTYFVRIWNDDSVSNSMLIKN